jgi:hypothetical protein
MLNELAGSDATASDQTAAEPGQTAEHQPGTATTEAQDATSETKPEAETKQFSQDEVNKLIRDRLARERRNNDRRLGNLERQLVQVAAQRQAPAQAAAEPKLDQFDGNYEQFQRALIRHEAGNVVTEREHTSRQAQAKAEADYRSAQATMAFQTRADVYRSTVDDFDEVIEPVLTGGLFPPAVDAALADYLGSSENGPAVAYALGNDAKLMAKIARLSPVMAVEALARLAVTIEAKAKTTTKAPEPVRPISGKSASASSEQSDREDISSWMEKEFAKRAARRRP